MKSFVPENEAQLRLLVTNVFSNNQMLRCSQFQREKRPTLQRRTVPGHQKSKKHILQARLLAVGGSVQGDQVTQDMPC